MTSSTYFDIDHILATEEEVENQMLLKGYNMESLEY